MDATTEFEAESILAECVHEGKKQYLVKWVGYENDDDNTWEGLKNLAGCEDMIRAFHEEQAELNRQHLADLAAAKQERRAATAAAAGVRARALPSG
jgi:hypothetical protein